MTAAAAGHAGGADLALLRELAADAAEVLVVDDVDLVPAIRAGLAPACAGRSLAITPTAAPGGAAGTGLLSAARFTCHLLRHLVDSKESPRGAGTPRSVSGEKPIDCPAPGRNPHGRWAGSSSPGAGSTARVLPLGRRPFIKRSGLRLGLKRNVVVRRAGARRRWREVGGVGRYVALRREAVAVAAA